MMMMMIFLSKEGAAHRGPCGDRTGNLGATSTL